MESNMIVRAWKDSEYRNALSEAEKALLPAHPVGLMELTDAELAEVAGGKKKRKKRKKNRSRSRSRGRS
jgi:mersacidin/lichenicidin family type 2 lantibiotic